jgi:hypothetical protein
MPLEFLCLTGLCNQGCDDGGGGGGVGGGGGDDDGGGGDVASLVK